MNVNQRNFVDNATTEQLRTVAAAALRYRETLQFSSEPSRGFRQNDPKEHKNDFLRAMDKAVG